MNDPKAKPEQQFKTDLVDQRRGACDPVSSEGHRSGRVTEVATPRETAQPGADVRPDPLYTEDEILPEGLKRPRIGPDHKPVN